MAPGGADAPNIPRGKRAKPEMFPMGEGVFPMGKETTAKATSTQRARGKKNHVAAAGNFRHKGEEYPSGLGWFRLHTCSTQFKYWPLQTVRLSCGSESK